MCIKTGDSSSNFISSDAASTIPAVLRHNRPAVNCSDDFPWVVEVDASFQTNLPREKHYECPGNDCVEVAVDSQRTVVRMEAVVRKAAVVAAKHHRMVVGLLADHMVVGEVRRRMAAAHRMVVGPDEMRHKMVVGLEVAGSWRIVDDLVGGLRMLAVGSEEVGWYKKAVDEIEA
jgi:hypothetical protein